MLTTKKSDLAAALTLVSTIVEKRNTIPILSNVAIERTDTGLRARMTDLDLEAELDFTAAIGTSFQPFTVPAHLLSDIVRKLTDGADITMEAKGDKASPDSVTLKSGRSKFSLQSLPANDLGSMNSGTLPFSITMQAKALLAALTSVSFAMSTEETRYYLNGIFMHPAEGGMMFVATDGHRLAKRYLPIDEAPEASAAGVIIPRKTIGALLKILPKDGDVTVEWNDAKIRFVVPGIRMLSKLIDGTFPDYMRVVPHGNGTEVILKGKDLAAAVDRVQSVSTERGRAMRFSFGDGQLTMTVNNPDAGSAEDQISYEGKAEMSTGFNSAYVLDVVKNLSEGEIRLSLDQDVSPAIFRAGGDHVENLIVLMPMRV